MTTLAIVLLISVITIVFSQNAKEFRICFRETEGSSQCQGTRNSCSGWSSSASYTAGFRDDTDDRSGGCKYSWLTEEREISPATTDKFKYRVCFLESEGSSQCQGSRNTCSGWNNSPSFSSGFRDDTDGRSGGCNYRWKIEQQKDSSLSATAGHCQICFSETEGSSQCQGTRNSCSGYSNVPAWTAEFRDDTDGRGGGCNYSWKFQCQLATPFPTGSPSKYPTVKPSESPLKSQTSEPTKDSETCDESRDGVDCTTDGECNPSGDDCMVCCKGTSKCHNRDQISAMVGEGLMEDINDVHVDNKNNYNGYYNILAGGIVVFILINNIFICYWCACKNGWNNAGYVNVKQQFNDEV